MITSKVIYFPLQNQSQLPDRIFLDTSIIMCLMITNPDYEYQKTYIQDFLKQLISNNRKIATCTHAIQEANYIILKSKIEDDLMLKGETEQEAKGWIKNHYKKDKKFINSYIPNLTLFHQWVIAQNWEVYSDTADSTNKSLELMEKYSLLPRDAYILANAFERGFKNIAVKDKDFHSIDKINNIYCPSYYPPRTNKS